MKFFLDRDEILVILFLLYLIGGSILLNTLSVILEPDCSENCPNKIIEMDGDGILKESCKDCPYQSWGRAICYSKDAEKYAKDSEKLGKAQHNKIAAKAWKGHYKIKKNEWKESGLPSCDKFEEIKRGIL